MKHRQFDILARGTAGGFDHLVWAESVGILLVFWFFCFIFWNVANDKLTGPDEYVAPYMLGATMWWAQWGLLVPFSVTVVFAMVGGFALIRRGASHRAERTERVFATSEPANDFEPSPEEREMESRIDELLDQDGREDRH